MLMREWRRSAAAAARFQRKVQLAQLCVGTGHDAIAFPILAGTGGGDRTAQAGRLGSRRTWWRIRWRCSTAAWQETATTPEERQKLYAWICRLDPLQALNVAR